MHGIYIYIEKHYSMSYERIDASQFWSQFEVYSHGFSSRCQNENSSRFTDVEGED